MQYLASDNLPVITYIGCMKTGAKNDTSKLHAALRKKIGTSGFKNYEDFVKNAGLFEGQNITIKTLREKAWKRT